MKKKLIPSLFINNGVCYLSKDGSLSLNGTPLEYAKMYEESGADEILVFELSSSDEEHDANLDIIKEIAKEVSIPLIGAGNVKRMEDIKKLLYAGCKRACIDLTVNMDIFKEVSDKFGKDKIIAIANNKEAITDNTDLIKSLCNTCIVNNIDILKEDVLSKLGKVKAIITLPEINLDKLIEILKADTTEGVTGLVVNSNYKEFKNIKDLVGETYTPFKTFKLNSDGLIPVIVQDYKSLEVLMLAYMNEEAYEKTVQTKTMTYFSRSRQSLWIKGETSGHYQYVKSLSYDCDNDTLLAKVEQIGNACHTGAYSCFFNDIISYDFEEKNPMSILNDVYSVIMDRKVNPKEGSYTNYLFDKGIDKILKKVGEEATEIVIAAKNPNANEIKYEISDFLYHVMVLMAEKGVTWEEIMEELANR